jgi:hypothetical protein
MVCTPSYVTEAPPHKHTKKLLLKVWSTVILKQWWLRQLSVYICCSKIIYSATSYSLAIGLWIIRYIKFCSWHLKNLVPVSVVWQTPWYLFAIAHAHSVFNVLPPTDKSFDWRTSQCVVVRYISHQIWWWDFWDLINRLSTEQQSSLFS